MTQNKIILRYASYNNLVKCTVLNDLFPFPQVEIFRKKKKKQNC